MRVRSSRCARISVYTSVTYSLMALEGQLFQKRHHSKKHISVELNETLLRCCSLILIMSAAKKIRVIMSYGYQKNIESSPVHQSNKEQQLGLSLTDRCERNYGRKLQAHNCSYIVESGGWIGVDRCRKELPRSAKYEIIGQGHACARRIFDGKTARLVAHVFFLSTQNYIDVSNCLSVLCHYSLESSFRKFPEGELSHEALDQNESYASIWKEVNRAGGGESRS